MRCFERSRVARHALFCTVLRGVEAVVPHCQLRNAASKSKAKTKAAVKSQESNPSNSTGGSGLTAVAGVKENRASVSTEVQSFYDSFDYDAAELHPRSKQVAKDLDRVLGKGLNVSLLDFQKEGVLWMMRREIFYAGGIMADYLGLGKTVQMIALSLASKVDMQAKNNGSIRKHLEKDGPLNYTRNKGYRLLTVVRQLQQIPSVSSCSRITKPAEDLVQIRRKVETALSQGHMAESVLTPHIEQVVLWLKFAGRSLPNFETRALNFLDNTSDLASHSLDHFDSPELRTLLVVPASILHQWKAELLAKVHSDRKISIYIYHGPDGRSSGVTPAVLSNFDFVITSYDCLLVPPDVLGAEAHRGNRRGHDVVGMDTDNFDRENAGPLHNVHWKRVVLDEAHTIRHSKTKRWLAVKHLMAQKKWAMTATPLHNSIEDIQNLLMFVNSPKLPITASDLSDTGLSDPSMRRMMARSLQNVILRRVPVMIGKDGEKKVLVKMPEKTDTVKYLQCSQEEAMHYNRILAEGKSDVDDVKLASQQVFHVFALMTRLRQLCNHPYLCEGKSSPTMQCAICKDRASRAVVAPCSHGFCHECLFSLFRVEENMLARVPCPQCSHVIPHTVFQMRPTHEHHMTELRARKSWSTSTKLDAIKEAIAEMRAGGKGEKMIIFSHFTAFLDVLAVDLERTSQSYLRLDGTMTLLARAAVIKAFSAPNSPDIMLASKMAVGVGLNLTAANHVVVVDPWWNPAVEEQAIHRAYRIGQTKPVQVKRLIIKNSIEQYCYEVSTKKKDVGDAILEVATGTGSGEVGNERQTRYKQLVSLLAPMDTKEPSEEGAPSS